MTTTRRAWLVTALVVAVLLLIGSVAAVTAWAGSGLRAEGWLRAPAGVCGTWVEREGPGLTGSMRERMWEQRREGCVTGTPGPATPTPGATAPGES